jgi:L-threonylcarbamoyladenylate synthase
MLPRHYAPHAPLETVDIGGEARVTELARQGTRAGWLKLGGSVSETPAGVTVIVMPTEPAAYASQLYAALHELDDAQVQRIIVELPPEGEEWLTVRDRLRRASASV